jgi:hypothetical protein
MKTTPNLKIKEAEWDKSNETSKVMTNKVKQFFHKELNASMAIKQLPPGQVALESHMFVSRKNKANRDYDITKAMSVADGRGQDAKLYPDKSSSTLQMHSLYAVLTMYTG